MPSEWYNVVKRTDPCLSYPLSLSMVLPPDSFTVVLTEDGSVISCIIPHP